jgi:ubiquinol-cytochrome c reductase cytochrome c subunit
MFTPFLFRLSLLMAVVSTFAFAQAPEVRPQTVPLQHPAQPQESSQSAPGQTNPTVSQNQNIATGTADPQAIFKQRCAKCHGERGEGVSGVVGIAGPNIQAEHNPGVVIMALEVGPSHMPSFAQLLTIDQMRALADYVTQKLAVIPLTGGDIGEGGRLFRRYCAPCHSSAARGGALVFTGSNAPDLSTKSAALIAGAIRWGPGPMPSFPPSVFNDQQLNSIVKYVEFVQQPPAPGGSPMGWYGTVAEGFAGWMIVFGLLGITMWIEWGGKG